MKGLSMTETKTKQCQGCEGILPLSDFYSNPQSKDRHTYLCKECHKIKTSEYKHVRGETQIESHNLLIDELGYHGIYACPGSASNFKYVDIVAWGCIQIEIKAASNTNGSFKFGFTPDQCNGKLKADIIVLVCMSETSNSFHVFMPNDQVFFLRDKTRKTGIVWSPGSSRRNTRFSNDQLTDDIMRKSRDAWWLIEIARREKSEQLRNPQQLIMI
jgi:hypothetical protein